MLPYRHTYCYNWEGFSEDGVPLKGRASAPSLSLAKHTLIKQQIIIKKIHLAYVATLLSRYQHTKRVNHHQITLVTRQLATLLQAGIPLLSSFEMISAHQQHTAIGFILEQIQRDLAEGHPLTEALRTHPRVFDDLYCQLIDAGEESGTLNAQLSTLVRLREKNEQLRVKVKQALFYPALVMGVSVLMTSLLLLFVIPQFQTVFDGLGATLPTLTLFVIALSNHFQHDWLLFLGGLLAIGQLTTYSYHAFSSFRRWIDRQLLTLPIMGNIIKKSTTARMMRTLATTFSAGLPLFDALKLVANTSGNSLYTEAILSVREAVGKGQLMHHAFSQTNQFSDLVIQLISVGEESGCLDVMLMKIAEQYEQDVETSVDRLTTLIEPCMVCLLGLLVGGLVLSMYLPIFQMGALI